NTNVAATTLARNQELLTSNLAPEGDELTFIHSIISQTDTRLAHLDDELSRVRNRLKELEEERDSLERYRVQNKVILSPLRKMPPPPEVLGEIFLWTLPSDVVFFRRRFDAKDSPWVLTHVSSHWRAVAVSTPALWSLIVI
ncbi:hypothetical protein C8R44DRAFT_556108, partial [Mycena epipterygia]